MATIQRLSSHPITGTIGCVIEGADLTEPLSREDRDYIGRSLFENGVVFIRGPRLTGEQFKAFVTNYAPLQAAKFGQDENRETGTLADFGKSKQFTAIWHADGTFAQEPVLFTAIQAVELPPVGGDTCWSSMYAAYDGLSAPLRNMLDGLTAIHSIRPVVERMGEVGQRYGEMASQAFGAEHAHPVVLVHPETGRKALYVNASWTTRIVEMAPDESDMLLRFLFDHVKRPDFCMRWRWSPGDLAIWDNRCVQHYAVPDYEGPRMMQRVDTAGQRPRGPKDFGRC